MERSILQCTPHTREWEPLILQNFRLGLRFQSYSAETCVEVPTLKKQAPTAKVTPHKRWGEEAERETAERAGSVCCKREVDSKSLTWAHMLGLAPSMGARPDPCLLFDLGARCVAAQCMGATVDEEGVKIDELILPLLHHVPCLLCSWARRRLPINF